MLDIVGGKVIEDAFEVVGDLGGLGGQRDRGHDQRASLRAKGRLAALPATRASR